MAAVEISESVKHYQQNGRMTAGYTIRNLHGEPVFVGTFSECAHRVGAVHGTIRDARGLDIARLAAQDDPRGEADR